MHFANAPPLSSTHTQCEPLILGHVFVGATTENFFPAVSILASHEAFNAANFKDPSLLNANNTNILPDNIHVLEKSCMQRCGLTADMYAGNKCPKDFRLAVEGPMFTGTAAPKNGTAATKNGTAAP